MSGQAERGAEGLPARWSYDDPRATTWAVSADPYLAHELGRAAGDAARYAWETIDQARQVLEELEAGPQRLRNGKGWGYQSVRRSFGIPNIAHTARETDLCMERLGNLVEMHEVLQDRLLKALHRPGGGF